MTIQKGIYIEDRYEVLEKIGSGGMSDVFKARDKKLNRFVAIKFLKQEYGEDKNFVKNFQIEAQSAAALLHPNVVSVYDVNQTDGIYYIVMEYVDGITLKKYIERNGRLPVKEATSIAIQIAQGIDAAHNAHIIHRDIKPQNVLISREGKIKVTDFGIARTTTANTISTDILGSVQYISPEQARGGQVDHRTDIYSFGIVFYEMITGRLPFDGDSTVSIALKHIQENVPLAGDVVDGVPNSVSRIIEKCTQRKPDRRYQKTSSLLTDLKTSLITPNEDFVVLEPEPSESATIIMSEEDAQILRREGNKALGRSSSASRSSRPERTAASRSYQERNRTSSRYAGSSGKDSYSRSRNTVYAPARSNRGSVGSRSGNARASASSQKKKTDRVLVICGILAAIIIVAVLVFVCYRTFHSGGCAGRSLQMETQLQVETTTLSGIEVPSVIGMEVSRAQTTLEKLGFVVKVRYSHSDSIAREYVIEQSVKTGENLETGEEITLTVSSGQATVQLDNYYGQEAETVIAAIRRLGCTTKMVEEYSDELSQGLVIGTYPESGEEISVDTEVQVYVSLGPETMTTVVPDVIGYTESGAIDLLNYYNLYSWSTYEEAEGWGGVVMYQWPVSGTEVEEWTGVSIVVGIEPQTEEWTEPVYEEPDPVQETEYEEPTDAADADPGYEDPTQEPESEDNTTENPTEDQEDTEPVTGDEIIEEITDSVAEEYEG